MGFVTNHTDAMALANSTHQDGIANAIVQGVANYLAQCKFSTRPLGGTVYEDEPITTTTNNDTDADTDTDTDTDIDKNTDTPIYDYEGNNDDDDDDSDTGDDDEYAFGNNSGGAIIIDGNSPSFDFGW